MDIPVITPERRARFEAEFAEYWAMLEQLPRDHCLPDRTDAEEIWCTCSAYREMQIQFLLGPDVILGDNSMEVVEMLRLRKEVDPEAPDAIVFNKGEHYYCDEGTDEDPTPVHRCNQEGRTS